MCDAQNTYSNTTNMGLEGARAGKPARRALMNEAAPKRAGWRLGPAGLRSLAQTRKQDSGEHRGPEAVRRRRPRKQGSEGEGGRDSGDGIGG